MRSAATLVTALAFAAVVQTQAVTGALHDDGKTGTLLVRVSEEGTGKSVPIANALATGMHAGTLVDTATCAMLVDLPPGQWILTVQVLPRDAEIDTVTVVAQETTRTNAVIQPLTAREPDCVLDVRPIGSLGWSRMEARLCEWRVTSTRPAASRDVSFEQGVPFLSEPENSNSVSGPGGLRAVVRNLQGHHPSILIEDTASGSSKLLLKPWASGPKWSPDGRWIACNVYGSMTAPYNLALVDIASGRVWQPYVGAGIEQYRWSPDSQQLALEVQTAKNEVVGVFSLSAATFTPLDTLTVLGEYVFAWSPDSRALAVSKPTFADPANEDEVTQSDLWIMDMSGMRCRLVQGKGFLAAEPRWIDSSHVRYERNVWKTESSSAFVIALSRTR